MAKAKVVKKPVGRPASGRAQQQGNATRVVKSAGAQNKKAGDKVRRVQPAAKPAARGRPPAQPKLVLLDPKPTPGRANAKPANKPAPRNAPKTANDRQNRPNSANSRPTSARQQAPRDAPAPRAQASKSKGSVSELTVALQTANSIAINRAHPKQAEVVELLRTHEKGWIDDHKFMQVLRGLAF